MSVQTLIYAYLAICVSMIVFNCVCIFIFRHRDRRMNRRSKHLEKHVQQQIYRLKDGEAVERSHIDYLYKKLKRADNLTAFDLALDEVRETARAEEAGPLIKEYIAQVHQVFIYLALYLKDRNDIRQAHFAYLVAKYHIIEDRPVALIMDSMLRMVYSPNIYCRENALIAIYSSGDAGSVVRALQILNEHKMFHHSKLLTDGLLTFHGSHELLIRQLFSMLAEFSAPLQVSILNYIRFYSGDYQQEMLALLTDEQQDHEIRFSCIRYFGRYPYQPAYPTLLEFMRTSETRRWEYTAIASSALASYPGRETVDALKKALCDANWYIRYNASDSLLKLDLSYPEMADILDGHDRFAREILLYRIDHARSRKEAAEKAKAKEAAAC